MITTESGGSWARLSPQLHRMLIIALVACAPLAAGDSLSMAASLWLLACLAAWMLLAIDAAAGLRRLALGWRLLWLLPVLAALGLGCLQAGDPAPAVGWSLIWLSLPAVIGYFLLLGPGLRGWLSACLLVALVWQLLLAAGQYAWVLPQMRTAVSEQALPPGVSPAMLLERISKGGVYTTFTVANILAVWLVMLATLLCGLWRRLPGLASLLLAAVLLALLACAAKGAVVAIAAAGIVALSLRLPRRWAWAPAATGGLAAMLVLLLPALREPLAASIAVRLDYWQAATHLIVEEPWLGHGLGDYAHQAARVQPPEAAYARHAHQVWLQLLVELGILGCLGLLLGLIGGLWRRLPKSLTLPEPNPEPTPPPASWPVLLTPLWLMPYLGAFGLAGSDNLQWWPGGQPLWYLVAFGGIGSIFLYHLRQLSAPPPIAVAAAFGAWLAGTCLDFHAHQLGSLITLTAFIGLLPWPAPRPGRGRSACLVVAVAAGLLATWLVHLARLQGTDARTTLLEATQQALGAGERERLGQLLAQLQAAAPQASDPGEMLVSIWQDAWQAAWQQPASLDLLSRLAALAPQAHLLPAWQRLAAWAPSAAGVQADLAIVAAAAGDWGLAEAALARARRLQPYQLRLAEQELQLLEARLAAGDGDAVELRQAQTQLRQWLAEWQHRVAFDKRLGSGRAN